MSVLYGGYALVQQLSCKTHPMVAGHDANISQIARMHVVIGVHGHKSDKHAIRPRLEAGRPIRNLLGVSVYIKPTASAGNKMLIALTQMTGNLSQRSFVL